MLGGDAGLGVEAREDGAVCGAHQPRETELDPLLIPRSAILLGEQQETAAGVDATGEARGVQVLQREERECLRHSASRVLRQQRRQAHRFRAELETQHCLRL